MKIETSTVEETITTSTESAYDDTDTFDNGEMYNEFDEDSVSFAKAMLIQSILSDIIPQQ